MAKSGRQPRASPTPPTPIQGTPAPSTTPVPGSSVPSNASGKGKGKSAKRKADDELSTNPHSVRRRKQREGLDDAQLQLRKAVDSDRAFRGYHRRTFLNSAKGKAIQDEKEREKEAKKYVAGHWHQR